jgi:PilZ domain-containing protein
MLSLPLPRGRQSTRVTSKRRASIVVSQSRYPCLVLDFSLDGFRLRGSFHLKRSQMVELVLEEFPPICERCSVVWVGKAGSKHEGEAGLQVV